MLSVCALMVGFAGGAAAHQAGGAWLAPVPVLSAIGQLWLNALLMIALPLVTSLLVVAILGAERSRQAGRLGGFTVLWFVVMLLGAGAGTVAAGAALVRWFPASASMRAAMHASMQGGPGATVPGTTGTFRDWLTNLVPSNLVHALAGGEMLPVIVAALLFGMAVRTIADDHRSLLLRLFEAVSAAALALAGYLLRLLPLGVLALTFVAAANAGPMVAGGVAYYVVAVSILLIAATLLLYPVTWWFGRIPVRRFFTAVLPCQVMALTTRSSLATLPSMLDRGENRIGLPSPVAKFVLPLSASVFKLNRTISAPLKVIVLSHLYGVSVDSGVKLLFVLIAAMLSFGTPGLPSGGSLMTLPFYVAAGLPIQGVILIDAVDSVPDIFKTLLNVTADMSVATIVSRYAGFRLAPRPGAAAVPSAEAELAA